MTLEGQGAKWWGELEEEDESKRKKRDASTVEG